MVKGFMMGWFHAKFGRLDGYVSGTGGVWVCV